MIKLDLSGNHEASAADGAAALDAIIEALGERAARGEAVAILWDMDGTLVDTRLRMLAAVHAFGRTDVRLDQVSPSWQDTAARLGLPPDRFLTAWQRVFWAYESFDADTEIELTAQRARRAEELGIQTIIVTGRIEELRPVTERQLGRLGLKQARVFLKAAATDPTPDSKAQVIVKLASEGVALGAFVTDSHDEIAAVGPDVRAQAPGLACIFVEVGGFASAPPPAGTAIFRVPESAAAAPPRPELFAAGAPESAGPIQFGFEAEYEIDVADRLLVLYDPDPTTGVSPETFQSWKPAKRAAWVRARFPAIHSEDFDLPVVRRAVPPELAFLPDKLIIDSDGNVEVISIPTASLAKLWRQIETLEHHCGPPLWQATLSVPSAAAFGEPPGDPARVAALDGFFTFHQLADTFERMAVGAAHAPHAPEHASPGTEGVLRPFLHPWLGPTTRGKHRFMRMYLEANPRGEKLDEKWTKLVKRAFSSFKYVGGSAYRPALAGPDRVAVEIRDAHRNKPLLARRLVRNTAAFVAGLEPFAPFAQVWAFDSEADYDRLPELVRQTLERAIPTTERPEIAWMYSAYDKVALQPYRNWALPMKDWSDVERALGDEPGDPRIEEARDTYLASLMYAVAPSGVGAVHSRLQSHLAQKALSRFAVDSGLHERLQAWQRRIAADPAHRAARAAVEARISLAAATPPTAWRGTLANRLTRLAARWPASVRVRSDAAFRTRGGDVRAPLLVVSTHGLDEKERARLAQDVLDARAAGTLGVSATDRGSLELRVGELVLSPGTAARDANRSEPRLDAWETLLALSPLEAHAVQRHLAAHDPIEHAARRVCAPGWLRHLDLGGATLEHALSLPPPEPIETAKQVIDRIVHAAGPRLACIARWIAQPLEQFAPPGDRPLEPDASTLASGFPERLAGGRPLPERLAAFVARWPANAKLVEGVPFTFGNGTHDRRVLVIAMAGLSGADAERLGRDYVATVGRDTVSFPLREAADHLRTRIGALAFALSAEGVRVDEYQAPTGRRRIEAVLALTDSEMSNLRRYTGAVLDDVLGVLGPVTMGGGTRRGTGSLSDNRPLDDGKHNCTTWITLAPVGDSGEDLCALAQMPAAWTSHDNPGWWSTFLTGASRSPRADTVVYWTDRPLAEDPVAPGKPIAWNFNPK